mgnify:CR=1 FL=1
MDVVSLYQNGFKTVVAPLGTAVTRFQLEAMWRYCKCPTIIFDGDEAGQKAALRAARLSLPLLKPEYSLKICILPNGEVAWKTLIKPVGYQYFWVPFAEMSQKRIQNRYDSHCF